LNFVGSTVNEQVPSGWNLSEDGGRTWIDGNLPMKGSLGGGDPVPGFDDKHKQLVFASLSFVCGQLAPLCARGNIEFASAPFSQLSGDASKDDVNFSDQTIYNGNGSDAAAQQNFLDKLWMAVDNNKQSPGYGNIYVTFTKFRFESGAYDESPIWFIYSQTARIPTRTAAAPRRRTRRRRRRTIRRRVTRTRTRIRTSRRTAPST
jgi:hypothetical protein